MTKQTAIVVIGSLKVDILVKGPEDLLKEEHLMKILG